MDVPPLLYLVPYPIQHWVKVSHSGKNSLSCFSRGFSLSWLEGRITGLFVCLGIPGAHGAIPCSICSVDHVSYGTIPVRIVVRPDLCHLKMDILIFKKGFSFSFFFSSTTIILCKGKISSVGESSVHFTEILGCVHFTRSALYQCFLYQDTLLTLPPWAHKVIGN